MDHRQIVSNELTKFLFFALQNALDLDLHEVKIHLKLETNTGYKIAERVYREGGYSKPVAEIQFPIGLPEDILEGTPVTGEGVANDTTVTGTVYKRADKGETLLLVRYDIGEDQDSYVQCQVGGNPNPNTDGCKCF